MGFDPELFKREMEKSLEIAEGVKTPTVVVAKVRRQGNVEILVAACPHCRVIGALTGEGKHLCRGCFQWLDFKREE